MNEVIIKKRSGLFFSGLLQIVFALCGTVCGFAGACVFAAGEFYQVAFTDRLIYSFGCEFLNEVGRSSFKGTALVITVGAGILSVIFFVFLAAMAGKFKKTRGGEVWLNWFDRIWSEITLVLFAGFSGLAVALAMPTAYIIGSESFFEFYTPYLPVENLIWNIDNRTMLVLIACGMALCLWIALASALSIVRKLKARSFWRTSLIGIILLAIAGFFQRSSKSILNAFAPAAAAKLDDIKAGVEAVRSGDLTCKIPVEEGTKGLRADLNDLAAGINDISAAADVAVQNELKNQRMRTELISNVSHDLKTPLTSMITYIDLLKTEGLDSPGAGEYLEIIDQKTQRLKQLTDNLFDAAKAASGNLPCKIESIDLAELVNQALGETDEKLRAKGLEVIVKNTCENSMVKADGQLLWRVIDNLLSNVCKYALENSRVYIDIARVQLTGEQTGAFVGLQVKNISRDQLNISADELMERFTRGDQSRNTEGSGLGLSIAKDLTQLMHGSFNISVDGDLFKALLVLEQA